MNSRCPRSSCTALQLGADLLVLMISVFLGPLELEALPGQLLEPLRGGHCLGRRRVAPQSSQRLLGVLLLPRVIKLPRSAGSAPDGRWIIGPLSSSRRPPVGVSPTTGRRLRSVRCQRDRVRHVHAPRDPLRRGLLSIPARRHYGGAAERRAASRARSLPPGSASRRPTRRRGTSSTCCGCTLTTS